MKWYLLLLKVQANQRFGISAMRAMWRDDRKRVLRYALLSAVVVLSLGMLAGMYTWLVAQLFGPFRSLGMENVLLGVALIASMLLVFFLGLIYLLGLLFFAKDAEFLASLPVPHRTVFAAKFSQVLFGEIATGAVLLLPVMIVYGVQTGAGALYWLRALVIVLLAPAIPLSLSAFLSLLLMRFTALLRHRELMTLIGGVLLIVGVFFLQIRMSMVLPEQQLDAASVMQYVSDHSSLLKLIASAFPPSGWAAEGLLGGFRMLLLFVSASLAALCAVTAIAGRIYHAGAMAQLETAKRARRKRLGAGAFRGRGSLFALFLREWKVVLRSAVYALNGLAVIVMGPILMLFPSMAGGAQISGSLSTMTDVMAFLSGQEWLSLGLAGVFSLLNMMNTAATTVFSREGKCFYLLRLFPVSPARHAMAKYLFGFSVILLSTLLMGVSSVLSIGIPIPTACGAALLALLLSAAPLALSMLPDLLRPKLSWNSETEAIKQNVNAVLGMLIVACYTALLGFCGYLLLSAGVQVGTVTLFLIAASFLLGVLCVYLLCKLAERSFHAIEG